MGARGRHRRDRPRRRELIRLENHVFDSPYPPSYKAGPEGRSPEVDAAVVKLVITPACHAGGRGFESRPPRREEPRERWFSGLFF